MPQHEERQPNDWYENRKLVERLLTDLQTGQKEHEERFRDIERENDRRLAEMRETYEKRFNHIEIESAKRASVYSIATSAVLIIVGELIKNAIHK